ncbi:MAG: hypothetical protein U5K79_14910 [Cyclobacteriaceae bacterium]|nr:hypothetical protein [Cyclobacteriaceae bacterium]
MGDIIGNQIIKDSILVTARDTICLVDQSKLGIIPATSPNYLALNEVEQRKILLSMRWIIKKNEPFQEILAAAGEVYDVEVSLEEYLTYCTERAEKEAVQQYIR